MAAFYRPFTVEITGIPIIVYPCTGLEKAFDRHRRGCLEEHLRTLYAQHPDLQRGEYHIVILWNYNNDRMTDVWIFDKTESWGSGPLADVKIFRNLAPETAIGVSAGDGLILLGLEEEHRRGKHSLQEYLEGERPALPAGIAPTEEFSQ